MSNLQQSEFNYVVLGLQVVVELGLSHKSPKKGIDNFISKQAGAGVMPSSGLVKSWSLDEV